MLIENELPVHHLGVFGIVVLIGGENAKPHWDGRDHLLDPVRVVDDAFWSKLEEIAHAVRLLEKEERTVLPEQIVKEALALDHEFIYFGSSLRLELHKLVCNASSPVSCSIRSGNLAC